MYGPAKRNSIDNTKPRYSKLRASCDTCFLAKVKCSKTRPICSRCLACGADCKYSPSSRVGKPKANPDGSSKTHRGSLSADLTIAQGTVSNRHPSMRMNGGNHNTYGGMETEETEWTVMLGSPDGSMGRRSISSASLPRNGDDSSATDSSGNPAIFDPSFTWTTSTPHTDLSSPYNLDPNLHYRSKSMNDASIPQPWYESPHNQDPYSQPPNPNLSAPNMPPNIYNIPNNQHQPGPSNKTNTPTCNCFNTCLHALGALHNSDATISSASPFDVILTVNQKAVETCSVMLNCPICMSRSGFSSRTMFLGTILGMIIAIYQDASKNYFSSPNMNGGGLPLSFGSYRVANEDLRWLQMEIILRDLKKLEELFERFQQECGVKSEGGQGEDGEMGMHSAVTRYLCRSLQTTTECLRSQREFCCAQEGMS